VIGPQVLSELLWAGRISDGANSVPFMLARSSERKACYAFTLTSILGRAGPLNVAGGLPDSHYACVACLDILCEVQLFCPPKLRFSHPWAGCCLGIVQWEGLVTLRVVF
jgi:hypothetical protein